MVRGVNRQQTVEALARAYYRLIYAMPNGRGTAAVAHAAIVAAARSIGATIPPLANGIVLDLEALSQSEQQFVENFATFFDGDIRFGDSDDAGPDGTSEPSPDEPSDPSPDEDDQSDTEARHEPDSADMATALVNPVLVRSQNEWSQQDRREAAFDTYAQTNPERAEAIRSIAEDLSVHPLDLLELAARPGIKLDILRDDLATAIGVLQGQDAIREPGLPKPSIAGREYIFASKNGSGKTWNHFKENFPETASIIRKAAIALQIPPTEIIAYAVSRGLNMIPAVTRLQLVENAAYGKGLTPEQGMAKLARLLIDTELSNAQVIDQSHRLRELVQPNADNSKSFEQWTRRLQRVDGLVYDLPVNVDANENVVDTENSPEEPDTTSRRHEANVLQRWALSKLLFSSEENASLRTWQGLNRLDPDMAGQVQRLAAELRALGFGVQSNLQSQIVTELAKTIVQPQFPVGEVSNDQREAALERTARNVLENQFREAFDRLRPLNILSTLGAHVPFEIAANLSLASVEAIQTELDRRRSERMLKPRPASLLHRVAEQAASNFVAAALAEMGAQPANRWQILSIFSDSMAWRAFTEGNPNVVHPILTFLEAFRNDRAASGNAFDDYNDAELFRIFRRAEFDTGRMLTVLRNSHLDRLSTIGMNIPLLAGRQCSSGNT